MLNKVRTLKNAQFCYACQRPISDILPSSKTKVLKQKNEQNSDNLKDVEIVTEHENLSKEFRVNDVNIQMISKNLYDQLFKGATTQIDSYLIKRLIS